MIIALCLVSGFLITISKVGAILVSAARADAIADLTALAGVAADRSDADLIAVANDAVIESYEMIDADSVVVRISHAGRHAIAAARLGT